MPHQFQFHVQAYNEVVPVLKLNNVTLKNKTTLSMIYNLKTIIVLFMNFQRSLKSIHVKMTLSTQLEENRKSHHLTS